MNKKSFRLAISIIATVLLFTVLMTSTYIGAVSDSASSGRQENTDKTENVADIEKEKVTLTAQSEEKTFSTKDKYVYRLDESITVSPDSFEAWIFMEEGSKGGTIAGNSSATYYEGTVDWEIDTSGRMTIAWNNHFFNYTVENVYLDDGKWHHVAYVRDAESSTFKFYVDGAEVASVSTKQTDAINSFKFQIGVNYNNFTASKTPFDGRIREVTMYNGAISAERIASDMENGVTDDLNGKLIGNWVFGDPWTLEHVDATLGVGCGATLCSFEKYVDLEPEGEYDYTIAIIPDIQIMVNDKPNRLYKMTQWLADNVEEQKLAFAVQVGDLSDYGSTEVFYQRAQKGLSKLDGYLPYTFIQGNHDYDDNVSKSRASTLYDRYFPYEKHSQFDYFGGAYEEGSMSNWYALFETNGIKYLVINMEFGPRREVIRWAGRLCEEYPNRRVIINTHSYMMADGTITTDTSSVTPVSYGFARNEEVTYGQQCFDGLVKRYQNIFLVVCGHVSVDDVVIRYDVGDNGNTITQILVDPQGTYVDGVRAIDPILLMRFNESEQTVECVFYSVEENKCFNLQNQFTIPLTVGVDQSTK